MKLPSRCELPPPPKGYLLKPPTRGSRVAALTSPPSWSGVSPLFFEGEGSARRPRPPFRRLVSPCGSSGAPSPSSPPLSPTMSRKLTALSCHSLCGNHPPSRMLTTGLAALAVVSVRRRIPATVTFQCDHVGAGAATWIKIMLTIARSQKVRSLDAYRRRLAISR